jgi:formamidase
MVGKARRNLGTMDLVVFPRVRAARPVDEHATRRSCARWTGRRWRRSAPPAWSNRIWGCFSIMEANPHGNPYNTGLIIDDRGELRSTTASCTPGCRWSPGSRATSACPVCEGPNGSRIALIICHDGMFPEMAREAAYKGAEIMIRTAGYTAPDPPRLEDHQPGQRLPEPGAVTASVCMCGSDGTFDSMGEGMFVQLRRHGDGARRRPRPTRSSPPKLRPGPGARGAPRCGAWRTTSTSSATAATWP